MTHSDATEGEATTPGHSSRTAPTSPADAPGDAAGVLHRLTVAFEPHRDADRAAAMSAYMRNLFPFLGIPTPERRALVREALAAVPHPSETELAELTAALWRLPEREYQYAACDLAIRHVRACGPGFLPSVAALIATKSWWDTVDALASRVVGPLAAATPDLRATLDAWVDGENFWLARAALLHQLTFKQRTDPDCLFDYCLRRAGDREFFVRKAIGWALREYSKTDPAAVRSFVTVHESRLSSLSRHEALLWLERRAARRS